MNKHARARAFSLIECVVVVVALAVAVPPTLAWMDTSVSARADSVNTGRATVMATGIMENILADVASTSPGLGFSALVAPATYVDTPVTGLRDRIASVTGTYEQLDFKWTLDVGPLIASSGATTGDSSQDVFRLLTVNVSFPSASGGRLTLKIASMVTAL